MFKKIFVFIAVFLFGGVAGWLYSLSDINELVTTSIVSSELSDINYDVAIIDELMITNNYSKSIKLKFDAKFSKSLLVTRAFNPDFSSMTAIPKEGLCKVIKYHDEFGFIGPKEVISPATDYLNKIEPVIMNSIHKSQSIIGGDGCNIGGAGGICPLKDKSRCNNLT
ncbi:hypothetical protein FM037_24795 [Shewanella psychropiezotolerans]|uniref:Uncharacterized protein n=1 Tax=Shewanella psychropiezotolerans TaxID=2593655 RepID=A0ABX5X3F1_9GAMM|nr:hypothetical protein [Shewanella psychropiezotolerans]QDO85887.1 hypothetical protein FM037_24795 [Shewanella psychropiezotolerans]